MRKSIVVLSTGTELSSGRSRDSNGPEIAERLVDLGYPVMGLRIIPDDPLLLLEEVARAVEDRRVAAVIMTGGLGPTADDHTIDVLAELTGLATQEDPEAIRKMELLARRWKRRFDTSAARRQARVLTGCRVLPNARGLAPGLVVTLHTDSGACLLAAMPGVPQEMQLMFERELLPVLTEAVPTQRLEREAFYLYGIGESSFQGRFFGTPGGVSDGPEPVTDSASLPTDFSWGVTAARGTIKVFFESADRAALVRTKGLARGAFPEEFLERPVQDLLHEYLTASGRTLALAESCTGGWIGKLLTDRPGASAYFLGGLVSYANSAKQQLLGVSAETLNDFGAVSEECAVAMAAGARGRFGSDYGLSVTGIAGPDGGTAQKPVGTVFTAAVGPSGSRCVRLDLPLDRDRVREYSTNLALFHLYRFVRE